MNSLKPVIFPLKRSFNDSEKFLRVAIVNFFPFVRKTKRRAEEVEVRGGLADVAAAIQSISGCRLAVVAMEDAPHGYKMKNGTFVGIMGSFQRNEIDIFMGPAILNTERFPLADASPIEMSTYRLLTWRPEKVIDPFNFVSAFTLDVWLSVVASVLLLAIVCWSIERFLTPWNDRNPKLSFGYFLWDFFSRFFSQDAIGLDERWYKLCVLSFLLSFSVILMNFLSCELTSCMTVKKTEDFVDSYADVLRFPQVRIYAEEASTLAQMFTDPKSELFRKLRAKFVPAKGIFRYGPKLNDLISDVVAKKGVIVGPPALCAALISNKVEKTGVCPKLMVSTESGGTLCASVFTSKRLPSTLREVINSAVLTSREAFLYQKTNEFTMKASYKCTSRLTSLETKPLSLFDLQGCFALLAIGIFVSILGLLWEISYAVALLKLN